MIQQRLSNPVGRLRFSGKAERRGCISYIVQVPMKNFLVGLAIGVPTGMLLADHRQAIFERLRGLVRRDLRGITDTDGEKIAAAVNRIADHARERAGGRHESKAWQGGDDLRHVR